MPSPMLTPLLALYHDMNRLLEDVPGAGAGTESAASQAGAMILVPDINITETDHKVRITAEVPGAREADVEVMIDEDTLLIRAVKEIERQEDRQNAHVSERIFGTFQRALALPFRVDPEQVEARVENGVLTITLPKAEAQQRTRRVQVRGASTDQASGSTGTPSQNGAEASQQAKAPDQSTPH
ncbi:Hsp20/alpha crystallin family protein [Methylobacterium sp. J-070]|uniref:Hsp20/alpha crystallin family protein n=1 Tax=Methylobacterium sp. J-070 TaxID=2836650 RepID=UPI001FB9DE7D|nr:Hsp20/alpha crystallin family protein [Methylobacterium sp. J-070]MCJ2049180.1 Hsp20/alpha crystallin family protein [Methylobacterium sp. J-070]